MGIKIDQSGAKTFTRGRLKIFLGYADGVGKTYTMLDNALNRLLEGEDVVVGFVVTDQWKGTDPLLDRFEILQRKVLLDNGEKLEEMDVDVILNRAPDLVLVDNLAHQNAVGSRHEKRYQDVMELLDAGIHVYTTLNIQNLESQKDVVENITGFLVTETVPDRIVDRATEIELVDLSPKELRNRLTESGALKVNQSIDSVQFYREGNLTALRELALRRAAQQVSGQMLAYMAEHDIAGLWSVGDHILVGINANAYAENLVRTASRLASDLNAEWVVVHVEVPQMGEPYGMVQDQVGRALRLAEELGGKTAVITGKNIADTLLRYARKHNITKIIIGKSSRHSLIFPWYRTLVNSLIRKSGNIGIYIASSHQSVEETKYFPSETTQCGKIWRPYLFSFLIVAVFTLPGMLIRKIIEPTNLVMLYMLAVVISAVYLGRGPAILAAVLSVMVFDFFIVPPHFTFAVNDLEYLLTFAGLLIVGLVISELATRARRQANTAQDREAQTNALYEFSRDLAVAADKEQILETILRHVSLTFACKSAILVAEDGKATEEQFPVISEYEIDEKELQTATWVFKHGKMAGSGTETLGDAQAKYLPLKTINGVIGVLGIKPSQSWGAISPNIERLQQAFANQGALSLERVQFASRAQQAKLLEARERLQSALLNSISHDLRTPLVSITGALSTLLQNEHVQVDPLQKELMELAYDEASRLNRLVGNLLDMTRLEANAAHIRFELCDLKDIVGSALTQLGERINRHRFSAHMPEDLPLIEVDFVLMTQVFVNLFDNATKYAPENTEVGIFAELQHDNILVRIEDQGIGVPDAELDLIFEKLYRVQSTVTNTRGSGLGLTICKGIIEAHQGKIWAKNVQTGGLAITFLLPLQPERDQS